ncbi:MAG: S8 family serine peptidase [Spirochaetales bacterium]|nr:S8 family serine peptidase [Spirochaetales bacterium]
MKKSFSKKIFLSAFVLLLIIFFSGFNLVLNSEKIKDEFPPAAGKKSYNENEIIIKFNRETGEIVRRNLSPDHLNLDVNKFLSLFPESLASLFESYRCTTLRPVVEGLHRQCITYKMEPEEIMENTRLKYRARTGRVSKSIERPRIEDIYILAFESKKNITSICNDFKENSFIEYASLHYNVSGAFVIPPDDPFYSSYGTWGQDYDDLWGIKRIDAQAGWIHTTGNGIIVAVIDTGIDYTHEDLQQNIWVNSREDINGDGVFTSADIDYLDNDQNGYVDDVVGYDCIYNDNDPMDVYGHGSHCAGIIGARGNNQIGITGVAPEVTLMAVKSLSDHGNGNANSIFEGIYYAVDNGADVMNCSFAFWNSTIIDALAYARYNGVLCVTSAGNWAEDVDTDFYPGSTEYPLVVSASDPYDNKFIYTNYGKNVDIAAPGIGILSCVPPGSVFQTITDGYAVGNGTSMAAPFVSGLAALLMSHYPGNTVPGDYIPFIKGIIRAGTVPFEVNSPYPLGIGIINTNQAFSVDYNKACIRLKDYYVSEYSGDGDQIPESGEQMEVELELQNYGPIDVSSIHMTYTLSGNAINTVSGNKYLGALEADQTIRYTGVPLSFTILTLDPGAPVDQYNVQCHIDIEALANSGQMTNDSFEVVIPVNRKQLSKRRAALPDFKDFAIDNNHIVWTSSSWKINCTDINTNTETIIIDYYDHFGASPSISGNNIIWHGLDADTLYQMILYDMKTGETTQLTDDENHFVRFPFICNNDIIWRQTDNQYNYEGVMHYAIDTGNTTTLDNSLAQVACPYMYDDYAVWQTDDDNVYTYNMKTREAVELYPGNDRDETCPYIYGDNIVLIQKKDLQHSVLVYDLKTGDTREIVSSEHLRLYPHMHEDVVVWEDHANANFDIFMYDLESGETRQITTETSYQKLPLVWGSTIAWYDDEKENIFITEIPRPPIWLTTSSKTVYAYSQLSFRVTAKDYNRGDHLVYDCKNLPAGASFNKTTRMFTWVPAIHQTGIHYVIFTVSDSTWTREMKVRITVYDPNLGFESGFKRWTISEETKIGLNADILKDLEKTIFPTEGSYMAFISNNGIKHETRISSPWIIVPEGAGTFSYDWCFLLQEFLQNIEKDEFKVLLTVEDARTIELETIIADNRLLVPINLEQFKWYSGWHTSTYPAGGIRGKRIQLHFVIKVNGENEQEAIGVLTDIIRFE